MIDTQISAIITMFVAAVWRGTPLLLGTTGEIITEKSGSLNLGVEGTMALGAIAGYLVAATTNSLWLGIIAGFMMGGIVGLLYSFLTVSLKANQNVTGLTITIFGVGLYTFIGQTLDANGNFPSMSATLKAQVAENGIPYLRDIPYVGELLFSFNIMVYFAIAIAIIVWFYLARTKSGLRLRAVGENPSSADSVGINVSVTRHISSMIGSGIMGIGGVYMALVMRYGAWSSSWINGYGWIAVALVVFANWSTLRAIFGTILFGFLLALKAQINVLTNAFPTLLSWMPLLPSEFYQMLPYLLTVLVLIFSSMKKNKHGGQPAQCGINYFREDR
ncbi:MAG: ABC transporter permease [Bacillota bacterium]